MKGYLVARQSRLRKPFGLSAKPANEIEKHLGQQSWRARGKLGESKLMHTSKNAVLEHVRRYRAIASLYRQTAVFRPLQRATLLGQAKEWEYRALTELESYFMLVRWITTNNRNPLHTPTRNGRQRPPRIIEKIGRMRRPSSYRLYSPRRIFFGSKSGSKTEPRPESINEIRLTNFLVPYACALQFGICAASIRNSGRNDFELQASARRRAGNIGRHSQPYCA